MKIKHSDLTISPITFIEETHKYIDELGVELSGITSIIQDVLFNNKYDGVPEHILRKAAERGSEIHAQCQLSDYGLALDSSPYEETLNYQRLIKKHKINMISHEYLVSNNSNIATMIDCIDDDANLYDIKTTYTLDVEYVSWQLSICAYLFDRQNESVKTNKIFAIWLKGDLAELVQLERKSDEDIERLFLAYFQGTPMYTSSNEDLFELMSDPIDDEITESNLELVVSDKKLGSLTTNAKQIKELVERNLSKYDVSNYSEDNVAQAKADKAMLNKASKELNSRRLELEREFMKPFDEFKGVVNETVSLIKDCSAKIDGVVKGVEDKAKQDKLDKIREHFASTGFTLVPLQKIFVQSWYNKGSSMKSIRQEIDERIDQINSELNTIGEFAEDVEVLKAYYLNSLSLDQTIGHAQMLKDNRERVRQAEEARKLAEEEAKKKQAEAPIKEKPIKEEAPLMEERKLVTISFECTESQKAELENFLKINSISYTIK